MSSDHDHKVHTLWLCGILHAFTHLYQMALVPVYLLILADFHLASVEQSTLLVTVMGIAYYLPSYPLGVMADRFSRKKLMALGLAINGLGFVCLGLSPNYACALASVALAGFGGSFYHPAATALVARLYPARTGRALGLVAIGASVGFFISPIYSGWRAEATGDWRHPVVEMGVAGIIFSALFYWLAEEERGGRRASVRPPAPVAKIISHRRAVGDFSIDGIRFQPAGFLRLGYEQPDFALFAECARAESKINGFRFVGHLSGFGDQQSGVRTSE